MTVKEVLLRYILGLYDRFQLWLNRNWNSIQPHFDTTKTILLHSLAIFLITSTCLYISSFLFGAIYFYNMPTIYYTFDLNFRYNRECIEQHRNFLRNGVQKYNIYSENCFPKAVVDLGWPTNPKLLEVDQTYRVSVTLQIPESESNIAIGMFTVSMKCGDFFSFKATTLRYKPILVRLATLVMLWPLYLLDFRDVEQSVDLVLSENFKLHSMNKADINKCLSQHAGKSKEECGHWRAEVILDYPDIQLYSAQLHFTATFTGLQYIFYQWPVFSFVVGTALLFVPVLSLFLVMFYLVLWKPYRAILIGNATQTSTRPASSVGESGRSADVDEESADPDKEEHDECENDTVAIAISASGSSSGNEVEMIGTSSSQQPLNEEKLVSAPSKSDLEVEDDNQGNIDDDEHLEGTQLRKRI